MAPHDPLRLDVPRYVINYAMNKYQRLRPTGGRLSGIADREGTRGKGDFMDLVATEMLHDYFHDQGKQVASFTVSGRGDGGIDLLLWDQTTEKPISINVKTSDHRMREGLNLIIKAEELQKQKPSAYIQCIMRAGKPDPSDPTNWVPSVEDNQVMVPHLYVIGFVWVGSPQWEHLEMRAIDNTDGHPGGMLLDEHLLPVERMLDNAKAAL